MEAKFDFTINRTKDEYSDVTHISLQVINKIKNCVTDIIILTVVYWSLIFFWRKIKFVDHEGNIRWIAILIVGGFYLAALLAATLLRRYRLFDRITTRSVMRRQPVQCNHIHYIFYEDYFRAECGDAASERKYKAIVRLFETNKCILFYNNMNGLVPIAKSNFSASQLGELKSFMEEKTNLQFEKY